MEISNSTFAFGQVTAVGIDPHYRDRRYVTIAGQTFSFIFKEGLKELGLLRLTNGKKKVFLVVYQLPSCNQRVLSGWINPPVELVRNVQAKLQAGIGEYFEYLRTCRPQPNWPPATR